jgi:diguanylate cyclase (GGDEF)-like protein
MDAPPLPALLASLPRQARRALRGRRPPGSPAEAGPIGLAVGLVRCSPDALVAVGRDGVVASWNPAAERLWGAPAAEAVGAPLARLWSLLAADSVGVPRGGEAGRVAAEGVGVPRGGEARLLAGHGPEAATVPSDRAPRAEEVLRAVLAGETVPCGEQERRAADGARVALALVAAPILDARGAVTGAAFTGRDVTAERRVGDELRREAAEQRRRALCDDLTGLPNRRALLERAGEGAGGLALVVVDLDRFHELNEALGHDEADVLLRAVAARLRRAVGPHDLPARIGADRFALLLPAHQHTSNWAQRLAELHEALEAPIEVGGLALRAPATLGLAVATAAACPAGELLARAERALRTARRERVAVAIDDAAAHDAGRRERALAGELPRALSQHELVLHYQPQVELGSGRLVGVEALLRWAHPEHGLLAPGRFLPQIARSAAIREVTLYALEEALAQSARWRRDGLDVEMAVNLSVLNLLDLAIAHDVARLLVRFGVPPDRLKLEITEDVVVTDPARAAAVLAGLRAMGVGLALDDFGTGYSSLAYLRRLPVNEIKIDRSFLATGLQHPGDAAIVRATVDLARHLGLRWVAEGVETERCCEELARLGPGIVQGFHVARPMPAGALRAWARAREGS